MENPPSACIFTLFSHFGLFKTFLGVKLCAVPCSPQPTAACRLCKNVATRSHLRFSRIHTKSTQHLCAGLCMRCRCVHLCFGADRHETIRKEHFMFLVHGFVFVNTTPSFDSPSSLSECCVYNSGKYYIVCLKDLVNGFHRLSHFLMPPPYLFLSQVPQLHEHIYCAVITLS